MKFISAWRDHQKKSKTQSSPCRHTQLVSAYMEVLWCVQTMEDKPAGAIPTFAGWFVFTAHGQCGQSCSHSLHFLASLLTVFKTGDRWFSAVSGSRKRGEKKKKVQFLSLSFHLPWRLVSKQAVDRNCLWLLSITFKLNGTLLRGRTLWQ